MNKNNLLFVYGTLRQGMGNHPLLGGCSYLGKGRIQAKLYLSGWLPMIYPGDGVTIGEVYEIPDQEKWHRLDSLEGHPDWYERRLVPVTFEDGDEATVWAYFMCDGYPTATYVESGDYAKERGEWV
jgi:gamma-glutamylcyclotransferase (GGCT)/AIG2-like uncharacterized protein YtfP